MAEFSKNCDIFQGYNYKKDVQTPVGYITKIKIGDLEVPVSLVNDQLQKRLAEQRDRLKLPDKVGGIRVENGEVVVSNK